MTKQIMSIGVPASTASVASEEAGTPLVDIANNSVNFSNDSQMRKGAYSKRFIIGRLLANRSRKNRIHTKTGELVSVPFFRVSTCSHALSSSDPPQLVRTSSKLRDATFHTFHKIQTCGSVWLCPVCSRKISAFRATEIINLHNKFYEKGFFSYLVTFTLSHEKSSSLNYLIKSLSSVFNDIKQNDYFRLRFPDLFYLRALEITYSEKNGWHPHYHFLFFFNSQIDPDYLKSVLYSLYSAYLLKLGLKASYSRGIDVTHSFSPSEYLAKFGDYRYWDSGKELTHSQNKKSSIHPFNVPEINQDDFIHYSKATFKKRQFAKSANIKKIYPEFLSKKDEKIVLNDDKEFIKSLVTSFDVNFWNYFIRNQLLDELLRLADLSIFDDYNLLFDFINFHKNILNNN